MKQLLLFLALYLTTSAMFSQAPANDTVENATELTSLNYFESNIRLDLAAINQGFPNGCNTNGFSSIYYKFTATENAYVSANIFGSNIINSFVIAYTAPNLNVTSTSELTLAAGSACSFGIDTNFEIVTGQSYYILVHREDTNQLSSFAFSEIQDVPQAERDALIAFYNAAGGPNWLNNSNWNTSAPVETWFGVFTTTTDLNGVPYSDGLPHVWGLNFFDDNNISGSLPSELGNLTKLRNIILREGSLTGTIPQEIYSLPDMLQIQLFNHNLSGNISSNIQNLTNLQVLDIRGNNFSGPIPDLTILPDFIWLNITSNNFVFSDFENQFIDYQTSLNTFEYIPQANITEEQTILTNVGDNINLNTSLTSPNNQYVWFFNDIPIDGESGPSLSLTNIQAEQMGIYRCEITNTVVANLNLTTGNFILGQDPTQSPDYNALVDLYANTNGDNWINNSNWLNSSVPLSSWHGLTVENNRVTEINLNSNDLSGAIPSSITSLSELRILNLYSNFLIDEIPNFGLLNAIELINLTSNEFDFLDFETHFSTNSSIENFIYNPQNFRDNVESIDATIGSDYSFTMSLVDGSNVQYQWYRVSSFDADDIIVNGANTNTLSIVNAQSEDLDQYSCFATSTLIPGLTIKRSFVELKGEVSQLERDALIAFYNALDGDNWVTNTNWLSNEPVGTWFGVTTTGNKVVRIEFFGENNLSGQIPSEIDGLVNLESLGLGLNLGIVGPIPESIGNLTSLVRLRIQATGNTGSFPASIGGLTNLKELRVIATNMTGDLPVELGNLSKLKDMTLFGSSFFDNSQNFTGAIPSSFGNLINLETLDLRVNSFEGAVPANLSNLINLRALFLNDNQLTGALPDFSGLSNLASISLENNFFDFSDLEPLINNGSTYNFLSYSPQNTMDIAENLESGVGSDITLNVNDTNLNRNENITAMNNQYQWFKDNAIINGANGSSYTITNAQESDSGVYHCEITNPTLPELTIVRAPITLLIDVSLGIENENLDNLSLYPNPTRNWINIKSQELNEAKLTIYDVRGSLILTKTINGSTNALNIESLQNGIYILELNNEGTSITKRFIKN